MYFILSIFEDYEKRATHKGHYCTAECFVRAVILNNPDDLSKVKSILDSDILKNFRIKKSKEWYLGDQKEVVYLQLKEKIEISIADYEKFLVNNYS